MCHSELSVAFRDTKLTEDDVKYGFMTSFVTNFGITIDHAERLIAGDVDLFWRLANDGQSETRRQIADGDNFMTHFMYYARPFWSQRALTDTWMAPFERLRKQPGSRKLDGQMGAGCMALASIGLLDATSSSMAASPRQGERQAMPLFSAEELAQLPEILYITGMASPSANGSLTVACWTFKNKFKVVATGMAAHMTRAQVQERLQTAIDIIIKVIKEN